MRIFRDRRDAGEQLAGALARYRNRADLIVVALPRGGVPIGYEVATGLDAPLDVLVVRELPVPGHAELAMGAIAQRCEVSTDRRIIDAMRVSGDAFEVVFETERESLARTERLYRGDRAPLDVANKTVILVDDGRAGVATVRAAIQALRARAPEAIVLAIPVAPPELCASLRVMVEDLVCLATPRPYRAVAVWYEDFADTPDAEVRDLLDRAAPGLLPFIDTKGASHGELTQAERKPG